MKKDFFTGSIITDFKGAIKSACDCLVVTAGLGVITGFGTYTTLFGALILSFVFLVFYRNLPLLFTVTLCTGASIGFFNVTLGGRSSTLFAMLFVSSLILIFTAFFDKEKIKFLKVPKPVSHGFLSGCALICLILCFPLFLGRKTFCSLNLMFNSIYSLFQDVDGFAITLTLLVFAAYYYLSSSKFKNYPIGFISVLIATVANLIYGAPLASAASGFQNFKPVISADFGHFFLTLFCAFLLSAVVFAQTNACTDLFSIKSNKRMLFLTGVTGVFGSISGFITGLASPMATKRAINLGVETRAVTVIQFLLLLLITIFFAKIARFIPLCALGAIIAVECVLIIKKYFLLQKNKFLLIKLIYAACFILTVCNLIFGLLFSIATTLFLNFLKHRKYN